MKLLIMCTIIGIASVYSDEGVKSMPTQVKECARKQGVDIPAVEEVVKNKDYDNLTREMRCFIACVFKKQGLIGADGTAHKNFQRPEIAKYCKDLSGPDECEIGFKIVECMNRPEFFIDALTNE